jgi:hypothetical protein
MPGAATRCSIPGVVLAVWMVPVAWSPPVAGVAMAAWAAMVAEVALAARVAPAAWVVGGVAAALPPAMTREARWARGPVRGR